MTGPNEENAPDRCTLRKHQSTKVTVVRHDDTLFASGPADELPITASNEPFSLHIEHIVTLFFEKPNDLGMNVFIGEKRGRLQRHESTPVVMTTSFSKNRAAYRTACSMSPCVK